MCWFVRDAGPLILLPREALPLWEGCDPPSEGRAVEAVSRWDDQVIATDYDRACDVMAWTEVIPIGTDCWGLVIPEDAGGIAWLAPSDGPDTFVLVQSLLLDSEALSAYASLYYEASRDTTGWTRLHDSLPVLDGDLLLMPAVSRGDEVREAAWNQAAQAGKAQVTQVPAGTYTLDQYILPDSEDSVTGPIFVRIQRSRF
jgi:hypothetical protein